MVMLTKYNLDYFHVNYDDIVKEILETPIPLGITPRILKDREEQRNMNTDSKIDVRHDYMIDLETLGIEKNALIISVGCAKFNIMTGEILDEFYEIVDLDSYNFNNLKYTINADTLRWWMDQSQNAKDEAFKKSKKHLDSVLFLLGQFIKPYGNENVYVWGNGSSFDIAILENAYEKEGIKIPWNFRSPRDVRTLVDLTNGYINRYDFEFDGVEHNALDDAKHQVKYVSAMWRHIQNSMNTHKQFLDILHNHHATPTEWGTTEKWLT